MKTCHGCCHEAAETCIKDNKHFPSGEHACGFCIRNFYIAHGLRSKDNHMNMNEWKNRVKKENNERLRLTPEQVQFT